MVLEIDIVDVVHKCSDDRMLKAACSQGTASSSLLCKIDARWGRGRLCLTPGHELFST